MSASIGASKQGADRERGEHWSSGRPLVGDVRGGEVADDVAERDRGPRRCAAEMGFDDRSEYEERLRTRTLRIVSCTA